MLSHLQSQHRFLWRISRSSSLAIPAAHSQQLAPTKCYQHRQSSTMVSNLLEAKKMLNLAGHVSVPALRQAYFEAAKNCHPDLATSGDSKKNAHQAFVQLTQAYELLLQQTQPPPNRRPGTKAGNSQQKHDEKETDETYYYADDDQTFWNDDPQDVINSFRRACQEKLGVSAEIVEECKANPAFLQWLAGRTDGAIHWRSFLEDHGGLAPILPPHDQGALTLSKPSTSSIGMRRRQRR